MDNKLILIIGDVYTDVHLDIQKKGIHTIRLGGVFHAARTLSALKANVHVAYFAPHYLLDDIKETFNKIGIKNYTLLGEIFRSPNTMLIDNSKELSSQIYDDLLRENKYTNTKGLKTRLYDLLNENMFSSIYVMTTNAECHKLFLQNEVLFNNNLYFDCLDLKLDDLQASKSNYSYFFSSSSTIDGLDAENLINSFNDLSIKHKMIIFKENRGGSLIFSQGEKFDIPAYLSRCVHSVGVGDSYDAAFIYYENDEISSRGRKAAYIASKYSQTLDFEQFTENIERYLIMNDMPLGCRLPWSKRNRIRIYLAGADFPWLNTHHFDMIQESLKYHNFYVIRPIMDHGLIDNEMSKSEIGQIINKDFEELFNSDILVAIIVDNDPGMYSEIGFFYAEGKPVYLYDPLSIVKNNFVLQCITRRVTTIEELLNAIFATKGDKI
ncbi:MAG: nucleoside 2-deoxyribosyltransferase [Bacilli bacterium]|nr:nucleoside 2-deoxyribosyltransferase [Bacilli bacterium]